MTDGEEDSEEEEIDEEEEEEELDEGEYGNDEKDAEVCKVNIPLMHWNIIDLMIDTIHLQILKRARWLFDDVTRYLCMIVIL